MTIQNKSPFELNSEAPTDRTHIERRLHADKIENEQGHEGTIEPLRIKAAFAFRLAAIHAPQSANRGTSSSFHRQEGTKRNEPKFGIQIEER